MQGFYSQNKKMNTEIFQHTVLFFLNSYMKFENNFVGYDKKEIDDNGPEETKDLGITVSAFESSLPFKEDPLPQMHS